MQCSKGSGAELDHKMQIPLDCTETEYLNKHTQLLLCSLSPPGGSSTKYTELIMKVKCWILWCDRKSFDFMIIKHTFQQSFSTQGVVL